jgi:lipopolysaccharide transport system permease protein
LYTLTLHRISVRYKQSLLGYFWAVLHPLALMLVYTIIFSRLVSVPTAGLGPSSLTGCPVQLWGSLHIQI